MVQTVLNVMVEVEPASADTLRKYIGDLQASQQILAPGGQPFDTLRDAIPTLHFMSMSVFSDDQYDPLFILEVNFDDAPGLFWQALDKALGDALRTTLRLCKPPRDDSLAAFMEITAPGSAVPLADFLAARACQPIAQHQGHRGLSRQRIIQEGKLFDAIQAELQSNAQAYHSLSVAAIHAQLRQAMLPAFGWLASTAAPRIPLLEKFRDGLNASLFLLMALLLVAAPGMITALVLRDLTVLQLTLPRLVLIVVIVALLLIALAVWRLRLLERRDPSHDQPRLDPVKMRDMALGEDHISQNHMISIVHVKPGILRAILLHGGLKATGLYLRLFARSGYLQSMRTIHFANWTLVSNDGRLMFNSNFDGSWGSYLDDFIEKAHEGLSLVWTNGVGFPPTRFLFQEGATHGQHFKNWARHSMIKSSFWFSAYKEYTVNQIERHVRIADGLRRPALSEKEASSWVQDL